MKLKRYITCLAIACGLLLQEACAAPVLGVQPQAAPGSGVAVARVADGTPAQLAGIRAGDILLALDGAALTPESLPVLLSAHRAGDTVRFTLLRGNEEMQLDVQLAARAGDTPIAAAPDADTQAALRAAKHRIRLQLARLGKDADMGELTAAFAQLKTLTAGVVGEGEPTLVLYDAEGSLRVQRVDGSLQLSLYDRAQNLQLTAPLTDGSDVPPAVVTRCNKLVSLIHHSRAERSGMRPGDTVLSVDGQPAGDAATLQKLLDTAPEGAELRVWRVDHPVSLRLAAPAEPHKPLSLQVDWEAEEAAELRDEEVRGDMVEELRRERPDPAVLLRGMDTMQVDSMTFFTDDGTITIFRDRGHVYLRVSDGELSSLYDIGAPGAQNALPPQLIDILNKLQNIP